MADPYSGPIVTRAEAKAAGLRRFFTSEPCKRGHIAQRQTSNGQCWGCKKPPSAEYMAAWLARNPERRRAITRTYRERHQEEYRAYYEQNFDKVHARNRAWRAANQEAYRRAVAEWHKAHPEEIKRIHQKWVEANPEKIATNARTQRARRLKAEGTHTTDEVLALLEKQDGKCVYCTKAIRSKYHVDHIMPLALDGSNWISNLQLTCPTCNHRKNRMHPAAFAARMARDECVGLDHKSQYSDSTS